MVLDTTGSMRDPASGSNGSKLDSLKIAANGLVNQLEANNSRGNISMSVVPFAQYVNVGPNNCLLYTSPSPRDATLSRMPSSA